jgi:hypothetical protein
MCPNLNVTERTDRHRQTDRQTDRQTVHIWSHFVVGTLLQSRSPTVTFYELLKTCTVATVATSEHRLWIGQCKSCSEVADSSHEKVLNQSRLPHTFHGTVNCNFTLWVTLLCHYKVSRCYQQNKTYQLFTAPKLADLLWIVTVHHHDVSLLL